MRSKNDPNRRHIRTLHPCEPAPLKEEDHVGEMDSEKNKLRAALKLAVSLFEDLPRTDFLICAVTRSDDLEDSASALASNLMWHDKVDGQWKLKSPSIGQMTDLLVEAKMMAEMEKAEQESWRDREARQGRGHQGDPRKM